MQTERVASKAATEEDTIIPLSDDRQAHDVTIVAATSLGLDTIKTQKAKFYDFD